MNPFHRLASASAGDEVASLAEHLDVTADSSLVSTIPRQRLERLQVAWLAASSAVQAGITPAARSGLRFLIG